MSIEGVSLSSLHKVPYGPAVGGWDFHTLWGTYSGKPPITVSASLGSEGEDRAGYR